MIGRPSPPPRSRHGDPLAPAPRARYPISAAARGSGGITINHLSSPPPAAGRVIPGPIALALAQTVDGRTEEVEIPTYFRLP